MRSYAPAPALRLLVPQAVKDAECLLAIVDVTYKPEEALAMIQPGSNWQGPPMAVVRARLCRGGAAQLCRGGRLVCCTLG